MDDIVRIIRADRAKQSNVLVVQFFSKMCLI